MTLGHDSTKSTVVQGSFLFAFMEKIAVLQ